jgi:hypothetical protein
LVDEIASIAECSPTAAKSAAADVRFGPAEDYFTRYAEETKWQFAPGAVERQPAMPVLDSTGRMERPAHLVLID